MGKLNHRDFHTPFSGQSRDRVMSRILKMHHDQGAGADGTADLLGIVTQAGKVQYLEITIGTACETSESMTIDVLLNGVSILSAPYDISDLAGAAKYEVPLAAVTNVAVGDVFTVTRAWTTGGGSDTLNGTRVELGYC